MPYRRKGSSSYYISIGGLRRSAQTTVLADAKALEDKLNHDAWLQDRMGIKPPRSWKEAVVKWLDEKSGKVSIKDDVQRLRWLNDKLGDVPDISHISRERVDGIMQVRSGVSISNATPSNCTANKYVALIAGILNAAEREWSWGNRAPRLRYYKVLTDTGRALTVEEWRKLSLELPEHLRLAASFSVSTGLRAGQVFGLTWNRVSLESCWLVFKGTENKLGNVIPLNSTSLSILKTIKAGKVVHATRVFTYAAKPVAYFSKDTLRDAAERAGVGRVLWKDFRTTFNSWLAQNGVTREIRCRLMGHTTKEVQDRYTRLHVDHLRPYSEVIDTLLAQCDGQSESKKLTKLG